MRSRVVANQFQRATRSQKHGSLTSLTSSEFIYCNNGCRPPYSCRRTTFGPILLYGRRFKQPRCFVIGTDMKFCALEKAIFTKQWTRTQVRTQHKHPCALIARYSVSERHKTKKLYNTRDRQYIEFYTLQIRAYFWKDNHRIVWRVTCFVYRMLFKDIY